MAALGARYNNNPQIVAFVNGPGIDEEFGLPTKNFFECMTRSNPYMSDVQYMDSMVRAGPTGDILDTDRAAFPNKPVLLAVYRLGQGPRRGGHAAGYAYPVGLKQATLTHDNNNQWQSNGDGTLQIHGHAIRRRPISPGRTPTPTPALTRRDCRYATSPCWPG